jgi:hypothetical protein
MSDLQARIAAANPITEDDLSEDDLTPALDAVWLAVEGESVPTRHSPRTRYVRSVMATPRGWVALAGTTSAAGTDISRDIFRSKHRRCAYGL